jgi:ribonuclease P protein component
MNPLSLPKTYLLSKKSEYDNVYRGISIHGQLKGAVKRNRIKRIIREFFRLNRHFLQEKSSRSCELPSMDIVITVRKGFNLEKVSDVTATISSLLDRCSLSFQ